MRTKKLLAIPLLSLLSACAGFVQPAVVRVNQAPIQPTKPTPASSVSKEASTLDKSGDTAKTTNLDKPIEGYLRIRATTNMAGLPNSWDDDRARSHFKKLLVSIRTSETAPAIPIMAIDVSDKNSTATTVTDVDVAKLMRVSLDKNAIPGASNNPNYYLSVEAVPDTFADVADKLVSFAKLTLDSLPPGVDIATSFTSGGTSELVKGLLSAIAQEAQKYKDKSWTRVMEASVQSALAANNGRIDWVLCPDSDNTHQSTATDPTRPPQSCEKLPKFFACAQDSSQDGVLGSICIKDPEDNLKIYTGHAWLSLRFQLMVAPGTDVLPSFTCQDAQDNVKVSKWLGEMAKYDLMEVNKRQLSWYADKLAAFDEIVHSEGGSQFAAHLLWNAAGGAETDAEKTSWSDLYSKSMTLDKCYTTFIEGRVSAKVWSLEAKKLYTTMKDLEPKKEHIGKYYDGIYSLDLALSDVGEGDVSKLVKDKNILEEILYRLVIEGLTSEQAKKDELLKYPKCRLCLERAPKIAVASAAYLGDYGTLGIASSIKAAGINTEPLIKLKQIDNQIFTIKKKGGNADELLKSRDITVNEAAKILKEGAGVDEAKAKEFLKGPIQ